MIPGPLESMVLYLGLMHTYLRTACVCLSVVTLIVPLQGQINWSDATSVAPSTAGRNRPRVATDAQGNPLIIWGNQGDVMFTRRENDAYVPPQQVNPDSVTIAEATWMGPDIAAHGDTVYIVYKQTPEDLASSHVWCIRSFDGGKTFDDPVIVTQGGPEKSRFPAVTTTPDGHPIVAFMKFNSTFGEARWVVTRSDDYGASFNPPILASNWSDPEADVCDCCPGTLVQADSTTVMLYRDNNSNLRDTWAGISFDNGTSFEGGMNVDQQAWNIAACPASGPDGIVIGDTVYATFMNGASGKARVYLSASSAKTLKGARGRLLTENLPGLASQNFPRIAHAQSSAAIVWKQEVNGTLEIPVAFAQDIINGISLQDEPVAAGRIDNPDVAISHERIHVVWQDNETREVRIRTGQILATPVSQVPGASLVWVFPNPAHDAWHLTGPSLPDQILLIDRSGKVHGVFTGTSDDGYTIRCDHLPSGMYYISYSVQDSNHLIPLMKF